MSGLNYSTPQEKFWAGDFGNDYIERNRDLELLASKVSFFAEVLRRAVGLRAVCELGANIGLNIRAMSMLLPNAKFTGVEINSAACRELQALGCEVLEGSLLDLELPRGGYDLVLTSGVLIHINPGSLTAVYDQMALASRRYVLIAEYFNPSPVTIQYRGHEERLFKRDFAGEFLDRHADFELDDYGFRYSRGSFPLDNFTWFLLRRRSQ